MSGESSAETVKLPVLTKLAFGVGDLGPAIITAVNGFFLPAFLLEVARLSPYAVAAIFLIVKAWDAVNDPVMGTLSDRTNTRWGRRRPWLLFGAIPLGIAFFLHWVVPDLGETGKFIYYLVVALLLDTAFTAVNVAYVALTPELTTDYNERTSLNSYRFSFSILGGVFAAFLHSEIVRQFQDPLVGNMVSAAIWAFFITVPNFITFAFTRETHERVEGEAQMGFFEGLKIVFSNRAFVYVTQIYLLSWLCIQFVQTNLLLYVKYWIGPKGEEKFGLLILGIQVSAFVFVLIWAKVSERIGKKNVYYIGMTFWILVEIALFFLPRGEGGLTWLYVLAPLAGVGVAIGFLIPWSMLPDVIELDELETGQRREGIYYGFFVFLQKLGVALGIAFSSAMLGYVGYNVDLAQQPDAVLTTLRFFVSLAPAVILLISFVPVALYPITQARHSEILAELAKRRARPEANAGGGGA
ncbi:MAG: MFS transporter [Ardenticatenales bacterium]|nr:MFS transporter [Ardenticatenales bacterium]